LEKRLTTHPRKRRILYVQYTNPAAYPPLERSSQLLAEAGWEVLFVGLVVPEAERLRFPADEPAVVVRQLPSWPRHWPELTRYLFYIGWVLIWAVRWRPNWVYASDLLACPVALLLSCAPGLEIVYHEHDAPTLSSDGLARRWKLWSRRRLAARARVRILPNAARLHHFNKTVIDVHPTLRVWNCPRQAEVSPPRAPATVDGLLLLYQGSIVPDRLPLSVLEALAQLPDSVSLRIIGYETSGHRGYRTQLTETARRLGIEHRVQLRDEMPHSELPVQARQCDVGLALMPTFTQDLNMRWMPGASNKPFEYLASGLALLVSDLPSWREMFVEPGYAVACVAEDPKSVAAALGWLLGHPAERHAMGDRGRHRVAMEWNYEAQFEPVMHWLESRSG
jgi:glycosyltransferase involved in cell wall biosynthesis